MAVNEGAVYALHRALRQSSIATEVAQRLNDLGYTIVARPARRKVRPAARRGSTVAEQGPWLGKSHSARLAGG